MASNRKLTPLLAGRTLAITTQAEGLLTLTFADGSTMKVKTGEAPPPAPGPSPAAPSGASDAPAATPLTRGAPAPIAAPAGKKVKKVRQKGTELNLDLEDGSSVTIHTAEATSSVMLRDHAGKLEYAD